jgi:hypothetical protein
MVFVGFGFLFPSSATVRIAIMALTFAWAVEFSQLYHSPWINAVRSTLLGKLILGNTFNPIDLVAYAFGVGMGATFEWRLRRHC